MLKTINKSFKLLLFLLTVIVGSSHLHATKKIKNCKNKSTKGKNNRSWLNKTTVIFFLGSTVTVVLGGVAIYFNPISSLSPNDDKNQNQKPEYSPLPPDTPTTTILDDNSLKKDEEEGKMIIYYKVFPDQSLNELRDKYSMQTTVKEIKKNIILEKFNYLINHIFIKTVDEKWVLLNFNHKYISYTGKHSERFNLIYNGEILKNEQTLKDCAYISSSNSFFNVMPKTAFKSSTFPFSFSKKNLKEEKFQIEKLDSKKKTTPFVVKTNLSLQEFENVILQDVNSRLSKGNKETTKSLKNNHITLHETIKMPKKNKDKDIVVVTNIYYERASVCYDNNKENDARTELQDLFSGRRDNELPQELKGALGLVMGNVTI